MNMSGRHGEKTGMSGRHGEKTERNIKATGEDVGRADSLEVLDCAEIPRNKKKRKKKHHGRNFIIFLLIIGGAVAFSLSSVFNVKKFTVTGNYYYSDEEVIAMSGAEPGNNIFFGTGEKKIRERLMKDPYFRGVDLKRHLPSTLEIKVDERRQIATVRYGNKYIVIAENGMVLRKGGIDPKLTLLKGLTLSKIKVGEKVRAEEKLTLKETLAVVALMKKGNLYFKKIKVSGRYIKAFIYDTLIVRGTPERLKESIEKGNLQKVVNKLYHNKTKRGTINLGENNYISFSPAF